MSTAEAYYREVKGLSLEGSPTLGREHHKVIELIEDYHRGMVQVKNDDLLHSVSRFSEDDLKTCYRIGFNHAKAVASYQGDNVVEALKKADDMDRNIKWE